MSKKCQKLVAAAMKKARPHEDRVDPAYYHQWLTICHQLKDDFEETNEKFRSDLFLIACGVPIYY